MPTTIIQLTENNYDLFADFSIPAAGVAAVPLPQVLSSIAFTVLDQGVALAGTIEVTTDAAAKVKADTAQYVPYTTPTLAAGMFAVPYPVPYTGFRFTTAAGKLCRVQMRIRRTDRRG